MRLLLLSLLLATPLVAQDGYPPATLPSFEGMDPEVVSHIEQQVKLVLEDPADGERHAELGLAYEANTCFEAAERSYRNAVALLPDKPEWVYRLGVALIANGKLVEAERVLTRAADALKNTPVIQARLGAARLDLGDIEGAEQAWEAAIAAEAKQEGAPIIPQSRVGLAQVRFEQGRYQDAVALLEEALGVYRTYRHAHYLLGLCLYELGDDERADIELAMGLKAWPEFPADPHQPRLAAHAKGYNRRMMVIENILAAGDARGALTMLELMLSGRPDDVLVLNLMARAQQRLGQPALALETLRKSEALDSGNVSTLIALAVALINGSGQAPDDETRAAMLTEALEKTQAAVAVAPRQGRVHFFNGLALLATGNGQGAFSEMSLGMNLGCDEPDLYRQLTTLAAQMGRLRVMIEFAEKNAARRPFDLAALQLLIQAYLTDNRLDEAEAVLLRLKKFHVPDLAPFTQRVEEHIAQKRAEQAPQSGPPVDDDDKNQ
jgi:Flp pilus assembly protein TadD